MKTNVKNALKYTFIAIIFSIFTLIFRRFFIYVIIFFDLPPATQAFANWFLLFFALWVPRQVFYIPLLVSATFSFYWIYTFTGGNKLNAYTGNLLNLLMVIVIAETFKYSFARIKKINKKLVIERERADSATKRKDIFMAKMSHELRTPLNGIMGITDLLLEDEVCKKKVSFLDMIKEGAETLQYLIDDLLDLSKIENDLITLNNKKFMLETFFEGMIKQFEFSAKKKNITIIPNISVVHELCVYMDSNRMKQIYSNLLSNAIKYTDRGGTVTFQAKIVAEENVEQMLRVDVSDNGIGIVDTDLEKVFNSFYRSIDSYNNQTTGVGLGLYIVKRLVDLFEGTISVKSEVRKGSCFTIALPLQFEVPDESFISSELLQRRCSDKNLSILVAEDNRINAVYITSLLQKEGHKTTLADNGFDAVELFKRNHYDLILMDIQMPTMSGLEAVQKIRQFENKNEIKPVLVAAITAYAAEGEQREISKAGFDYYITKPVDSSKLFYVLRMVTSYSLLDETEL